MQAHTDIHDDLHGTVRLESHERAIIDSPWFQRLRGIKQLGLTHMVFPGAEHTRFAHSIGVFHLASRLAEKFEREQHLKPEECRELRAAALLHDIGHFPFSHTLEKVYEGLADPSPAEWTEPVAEARDANSGESGAYSYEATQFHERFGRALIEGTDVEGGLTRILRSASLDPQRVGAIVVGAHENVLLNQMVHSDLDVDQLDYLLRDAQATGSTYGQYDLGYLLECLEVVYLPVERGKARKPVLCVDFQGLHPVEHYVLAKYFYYLCILYQKTRSVMEGTLRALAKRLVQLEMLPSWHEISQGLSQSWFTQFDDAYVWSRLRNAAETEGVSPPVREAARALLSRRLPKVDSEAHRTLQPGEALPQEDMHGPSREGEWNAIVCKGVEYASRQAFTVLDKYLDEDDLEEVLLQDSRPIRLVVSPLYRVRKDTPATSCYDRLGAEAGSIILLESLHDSIVAKLAGLTTYITRVYKPS